MGEERWVFIVERSHIFIKSINQVGAQRVVGRGRVFSGGGVPAERTYCRRRVCEPPPCAV